MIAIRTILTGGLLLLHVAVALAQPAPASGLTPDQARAALTVLNDPTRRAALIAALQAIAQQTHPAPGASGQNPSTAPPNRSAAKPQSSDTAPDQPAATPSPSTDPAPAGTIELAPDSLGAAILVGGSRFLTHVSTHALTALRAVQSLPLLWGWIVVMATDPMARNILIEAAWRLAATLLISLAIAFPLRHIIRRPTAALTARAPEVAEPPPPLPDAVDTSDEMAITRAEAGDTEPPTPYRPTAITLLRRLPLTLASLLLSLLPVLGFAIAGHAVAASAIGGNTNTRLILLAVVDAVAVSAVLLRLAGALLSPDRPRLRLFQLSDASAAYLMRWCNRVVVIAVFGYALAEVGALLGLSPVAHAAVLKTVSLVVHICLAVIVVQKRRAVRSWLRGSREGGSMAGLRHAFAAVWHWLALFVIVATWVVWAIEVPDGFALVGRFIAITVLVLIVARLLLIALLGGADRALLAAVNRAPVPELEARLRLYHPPTRALLRTVVRLLAVVALLQLYGVHVATWLADSALGRHIVSSLATLFVTVVLALTVWEVVNLAIQRYLARLDRTAQAARSARFRTLLPLLRTTLLITILLVAGLMVLSEIGINIAPLLAGAGIVGIAVGFGSQKLVQDLITGVFLLAENTMQVGDVVNVAGHAGVIESLSVRTIRLRAEDASVHVIPFSSVTTVTNLTKDYSRAVIVAGVAYKEDYDHVVEVLRDIAATMRAEPAWEAVILADLEVMGLDQLGDSAVAIKSRIMCTPLGRWSVQREFNRRMKRRFEEEGIEMPFPTRKLVIETLPPQTKPSREDQADE